MASNNCSLVPMGMLMFFFPQIWVGFLFDTLPVLGLTDLAPFTLASQALVFTLPGSKLRLLEEERCLRQHHCPGSATVSTTGNRKTAQQGSDNSQNYEV